MFWRPQVSMFSRLCFNLTHKLGPCLRRSPTHIHELKPNHLIPTATIFSDLMMSKSHNYQQQQQLWTWWRNRNSVETPSPPPPRRSPSTESTSWPWLMLPSEKHTPVSTEQNPKTKTVNLRFFNPKSMQVVKLEKMKLPEALVDVHCVGSFQNWLAYLSRRDFGFYLVNMFSSSSSPQIITLPSIETLPYVLGPAVADFRGRRQSGFVFYDSKREQEFFDIIPVLATLYTIHKVAMSSPPRNPADKNCIVMVIHSKAQQLAFCRLGDKSWTHLESGTCLVEVMYSTKNKLFYAVNDVGKIEAWDLRVPSSPRRITYDIHIILGIFPRSTEEDNHMESAQYLVEDKSGNILHVTRFYWFEGYPKPYKTFFFQVSKLDFAKQKFERVKSIGDQALFIGFNHSFSLSATNFPGLNPNSIYFSDNLPMLLYAMPPHSVYGYGGHDNGIYNLQDHTFTPLYANDLQKILPSPIWVVSGP